MLSTRGTKPSGASQPAKAVSSRTTAAAPKSSGLLSAANAGTRQHSSGGGGGGVGSTGGGRRSGATTTTTSSGRGGLGASTGGDDIWDDNPDDRHRRRRRDKADRDCEYCGGAGGWNVTKWKRCPGRCSSGFVSSKVRNCNTCTEAGDRRHPRHCSDEDCLGKWRTERSRCYTCEYSNRPGYIEDGTTWQDCECAL